MALTIGTIACDSGMSKAIYDAIIVNKVACKAQEGTILKALCFSIATGIVNDIQTNAVVSPNGTMLSIPGTAGGPITGTGKIL